MALTPEQKELARHRFERAEETLRESIDALARQNVRLSINRAYYAVFYGIKALLAIADKDSSKHTGIVSLFNQYFIKTGIVSEISFKAIQSLMDLRHEGDYQDFAKITKEEAAGAVESAKTIIETLQRILERFLENSL
ncbi:MAG: hypothetical protein HW390_2363 [Candidatus Brocadiaceae bacterium]|nr:hypothetical protein [Candidatus Brocadiaceae bacterium]